MCGIAGFSGDFPESALASMSAAIAPRGPDGEGAYFDAQGRIGLAHRRLAIVDLSPTGAQPMFDAAGRAVITYNGEIYNYPALRAGLRASTFRGTSDTEVLLNLYLRDGPALLPALNGIFAFALWDTERRELFLARDALGVKPLYYIEDSRGVAFASEIKALLPVLSDRSLDAGALHRYASFLFCPGDATPFRAVRKLGPGEALIVRDGRVVRRWGWYEPPQRHAIEPLTTERGVLESVRSGVRLAVERQLIADVPVGAFLSGGLDSSAVVAFARERAPDLRCFTIELGGGQDEGMVDDLPYARRVAEHLGVRLDVVNVDSRTMAADLPGMVFTLDEPLADPAPLNVLYISRLARQHGIKVLLSGTGGDDLFSGYRRHAAQALSSITELVPRSVRRAGTKLGGLLDRRRPLLRRLAKVLDGLELEGDARVASWFPWIAESALMGLYSPSFRETLGEPSAVAPLIDQLERLSPTTPALERLLALEQRFFLADHNLVYTDKMSMAAGVEVRVPLLDPELVALAAKIPWTMKQHGHIGKWALKRAMEGDLPHDVIYRKKTGFGAPLRRWIQRDLADVVDDLLSEASLRRRGIYDPHAVQALREQDRSGRVDASYTILSLMCVELWCRAFVDGSAARGGA